MSFIINKIYLHIAKRYYAAITLAWYDILGRYRRSVVGPFWLTISMGVTIASIGIVFGGIFETPMDEYLPFLTTGHYLLDLYHGHD